MNAVSTGDQNLVESAETMHLPAGTKLGPYEILSQLGEGGMGVVYKARDARLGREVAIKLLTDEGLGSTGRRARFETEARAASALNHPNILSVYDVGEHASQPYLVAELVEGESLRELLHRGPVPLRKFLDIATQIADGLAAAHAARITHRDLKPENIMITRDGRAKILDFGLAKVAQPATDEATVVAVSSPGVVVGTVAYMSPEQARGGSVDFRSDQFSLGIVLHEMLTGKPPFRRDTAPETMTAILKEDPPFLDPSLPAPLRWAMDRMLAKDPDDRYGSTRDLHRDLRNLRDRLSEAQSNAGVIAVKAQRRVRWAHIAMAAIVGAALTAAFAPLLVRDPPIDPGQLKLSLFSGEEGSESYPVWSPDGKSLAYGVRYHGRERVFIRSVDGVTAQRLTNYDSRPRFWSCDGSLLYYNSSGSLWTISAAGGASPKLVFRNSTNADVDHKCQNVLLSSGRSLWKASLSGGEPKLIEGVQLPSDRSGARLSPDGRRFVIYNQYETGISVHDYLSGSGRRLVPERTVGALAWFPDNRRLLIATGGFTTGTLAILDLETGASRVVWMGPTPQWASVTKDGTRVAFSANRVTWDIYEVHIDDGAVKADVSRGQVDILPDWAPTGDQYVFTDLSTILNRTREGYIRPVVRKSDLDPYCADDGWCILHVPAWSPDGSRIAFSAKSRVKAKVEGLWAIPAAGGRPIRIHPSPSTRAGVAWAPDGSSLAYVNGDQIVRIALGTGELPKVLASDVKPLAPPWDFIRWARSGILYPAKDGLILLAPDGNKRTLISAQLPLIAGFSRDGREVFTVRQNDSPQLPPWQLTAIEIASGRERQIAGLNLPRDVTTLAGFSMHPDGKKFLTSGGRWPYDIYILEGFDQQKSWLDRILRR